MNHSHTAEMTVSESHTALAVKSGALPVLATPVLAALMEEAAVKASLSSLRDGETTVGIRLDLRHTAPTSVGQTVCATASLSGKDGRKLFFHITAKDDHGLIGEASHIRYVVDIQSFMKKAQSRS